MNNQKYWERRKAQQMYEYMDEAEKVAELLEKSYKQASIYIQKEAQKIFDKYKSKHDLTRVEAELLLKNKKTPEDIEALRRLLKEDKKNEELLKEYESQAYKARIDRLSNLYGQLDSLVLPMIAAERSRNIALYEKLAEESHYQSIFDLQQYSGYGFNFKALDKKTIQKVLDTRWSGKNFSQAIWDNTHALAESVKKEILINLLTGRPLREAQQAIDDEFVKGYNKARRLVRTESAYVCNQIQRESYKACGVDKYIFVAILDLKTSMMCRGLDKKDFPVSKAAVGVNYPPMHSWCRSTTIAYVSKDVLAKMKQSAIDPVTGKRITVPGDMTYEEWYKKYTTRSTLTDVTDEYQKNATPGVGTVEFDEGYKVGKHQEEVKAANWLHDTYGGNIKLLNESNSFGVKQSDYEWRGKLWELKTTSTPNATDNAVRKAIKQIEKNPGGIILDYGAHSIDVETLVSVISNRARRCDLKSFDLMILSEGKTIKILRHKKMRLYHPRQVGQRGASTKL